MPYFSDLNKFIDNTEVGTLKEYYNKCFDTLKDISKRSNAISIFVLILLVCGNFPDEISESQVLGFKISAGLITILSPLLISFFIMEWCLVARRRRELMRIMKNISYKIFGIPRTENQSEVLEFSLFSRNTMPLSLMIEILNIDYKSIFFRLISGLSILGIISATIYFTARAFYNSFNEYDLSSLGVACNILGLLCWVQIVIFYISDFRLILSNK